MAIVANPGPSGFRPYQANLRANAYYATTSAAAMYIGDMVVLAGSSNTAGPQVNALGKATIDVATGADSTPLLGAVLSVQPDTINAAIAYKPASTGAVVWVADHPNQLYTCLASGATAATDVGANMNINTGTAGSTGTGLSGQQANASYSANAAKQLQLLSVEYDDPTVPTSGRLVTVRINLHLYGNAVAGV